MSTIFIETSQEKHHNLLFKDLKSRSVMFKLRRLNKNDILKQLDDITTPVMSHICGITTDLIPFLFSLTSTYELFKVFNF